MSRDSLRFRFLAKLASSFNSLSGRLLRIVLCDTMTNIGRKRDDYIIKWYDFVRCSSLELAGKEIYENNVSGAVAELGVYQGDFAQFINRTFTDRTLYLFDTFEGFDIKSVKTEKEKGFSANRDDFTNTTIQKVLNKMLCPEKCKIVKGYFPESAEGINEKYAFVSIDADLYEPIYNGLKYFYPRLEKGGYIFVHDYNNKEYDGCKEAVKRFSKENNISYFPLSDASGSAIFIK